jgi:ATP-dependent helicase HrpB
LDEGFLRGYFGEEMAASLPIDSILDAFLAAYTKENVLIVQATPGAGKTTRVAPALIKAGLLSKDKKILMLQPRRIAAKATAARIAEENGWNLGGSEVGYHVRFEKSFQKNTQLIIMTEGILSRKLIEDPELKDVACVILDEFHERSIHSDLALALLKELQAAMRPDLKIVVMSATLEEQSIKTFFPKAQSFQAEGRIYPLKIIYQPKLDKRDRPKYLEEQVLDALGFILRNEENKGNVLIFLPGVGEIKRVHEKLLQAKLGNIEILELHGSLSLQEQSKVLKLGNQRRIILSTNVAETSLTVPGVTSVIDSGLVKIAKWDLARNFEKLELSRISLASAKQRAGRAAREQEGQVYKLWSQEEEHSFKAFEDAEIQRVDLASTLLMLAAWGVNDFEKFEWFEKPSASKISASLEQLKSLGALDKAHRLTELGEKLQRIPLAPRQALALLKAKECGEEERVSIALALLSERDPFRKGTSDFHSSYECDLSSKVLALQKGADSAGRRILNTARDLLNAVNTVSVKSKGAAELPLVEILWSSYSDRLCRRREKNSNKAIMVGGRGVLLAPESEVQNAEFFLALEVLDSGMAKETKVSKATSLTREQLNCLAGAELIEKIQSEVDFKTFKFKNFRSTCFRDLVVEGPFPVEVKGATELNSENLSLELLAKWEDFASRFEALADFQKRILYVQKYCPEEELPSLSDENKVNFLNAAIEHAKNSSMATFDVEPLIPVFYSKNFYNKLNQLAPKSLLVPSGRYMLLDYSANLQDVKSSVKLQELFGWAQSPTLLKGKLQIAFDLLSPAQRPVQTTKDLASFWKTAYPELRSQLKIKYPRHPWPEDPWTAQATHKTKKALLK